ncbi:MAG: AAA family ATPase, partial [bacterium]|nr:AAA family ATPase [bacterium]
MEEELIDCLENSPAVALLGSRQCGKSTLAQYIQKSFKNSVYLDLENESDLIKLTDPLLYFEEHKDVLVCID